MANATPRKKRTPKFEYWRGADKNWYYHLKGANGEIMYDSQGFASRAVVLAAIGKHIKRAATAVIVEIE